MYELAFDELNSLKSNLNELLNADLDKLDPDKAVELVKGVLEDAYLYGCYYANDKLGEKHVPTQEQIMLALLVPIAGKTFVDRVSEYAETGDIDAIMRVAETDLHRVYSEGVQDTADKSEQYVQKKWTTMGDAKVRETHAYLDGQIVDLHEPFITIDGDSADAPGDFEGAENNVNCRCVLELIV